MLGCRDLRDVQAESLLKSWGPRLYLGMNCGLKGPGDAKSIDLDRGHQSLRDSVSYPYTQRNLWAGRAERGTASLAMGRAVVPLQKSVKGGGRGERPVLGTCKLQDPHGSGILALTEAWDLRDRLTDGEIEAQMSRMPWLKLPPLSCSCSGLGSCNVDRL